MKKRQSPYSDVNTVPYTNNNAQRIHQVSGINASSGRADSFPADHDQYYAHHRSSSVSQPYHEATGNLHRKQLPDPTSDTQNAGQVDRPRPESQEQDMEIGYEDNPVAPLNYQGLEKKFQDEALNLLKEQVDAEGAEIIRHKEKIIEISNQYQEKLSDLRAQQAKQREEFLRKESEALLHSYQQQSVKSHVPGKLGLTDDPGYIPESTTTGHLARKVGPIDNHGYIDDHGYIPEATTGHLARKVDHNDNNHGYIPEATTTTTTGHLARKVHSINGRVYSEFNGPEYYQPYSAAQYHNQQPDPAVIQSADKTRTSGRVPMPYGRVYNNSRAGV